MTKEEAYEEFKAQVHGCACWDSFSAGWDLCLSSAKAKDSIPYAKIIETINNICKRSFKPIETHKKHIRARWHEGMRLIHFERVCIIKNDQWQNDPKMSLYLRPETLFGTKMDSYLNEPMPKKKKTIMNHLGQEIEVDDDSQSSITV